MGDNRLCNIFCKYLQILLHSVFPSRCCRRSSIFLVETTSLSSSCPPAVGWDDIQDRKGAEHEGTPVKYVCFIYLSTCCQETSQHQKSALTEAPFLLFWTFRPICANLVLQIVAEFGQKSESLPCQRKLDCVTRAPLLLLRSWVLVALSFKFSEWVRDRWHLTRSLLCSIY